MSKSKKVKYDMSPYNDYISYLKGYDTSNVDNTLSNLTGWAEDSSAQNLMNMGDYNFSVDGSDDARQRVENTMFDSMAGKLNSQFERQSEDYATMLQNQGLPVGSEAYERAMGDLQSTQNSALAQAAYSSVLGGQNAFSQSLNDEIKSADFSNSAQQAYINQLLSALNGSTSGYDHQKNLFGAKTGQANLQYEQDKANANSGWQNALVSAIKGAVGGYNSTGSVYGALGGGLLSGYDTYNTNPYGK